MKYIPKSTEALTCYDIQGVYAHSTPVAYGFLLHRIFSVLCLCTYILCFCVLHNMECRVQGSESYLHSKFNQVDPELISKGKKIINIVLWLNFM